MLLVALLLCFVALAFTGDGRVTFGQSAYLASVILLAAVADATRAHLAPPSRWAAVAAVGGLVATMLFAITEIGPGDL